MQADIRLSDRLEAVLGLLLPCKLLVDVGTHHGLVPLTAVARGVAEEAIGVDRPRPLEEAARHWRLAGRPESVTFHASLGLVSVAQLKPDAVVIAGMGARTAIAILAKRPCALPLPAQLIVQPLSEVASVRRWAREQGLHLRAERLLSERPRFYTVLAFGQGAGADPAYDIPGFTPEELDAVGPLLLAAKDPVLQTFAQAQVARLTKVAPGEQAIWRRVLVRMQGAGVN